MLAAAQRHQRPNLEFIQQDIDQLDFAAEFDVVFSNATLHWVKDHERMLASVHRALKDGGRARFQFAADGNCQRLIRAVQELMARPEFIKAFDDFEWPWNMPVIELYRKLAGRGTGRHRQPAHLTPCSAAPETFARGEV